MSGCPAHVFIPAETHRKLDLKSALCTFIGYAENQGTRVYRLYQPEIEKIITSWDVVFDEADNSKHHIPEPVTNQEGDSARIPFNNLSKLAST